MYNALPTGLFSGSPSGAQSTASITAGSLIDTYLQALKPVEEIRRELHGHRERFSLKVPRGIVAASRKNNPLYLSLDPSGAGTKSKAMADKRKRLAAKARRIKKREAEKDASGMESIMKGMKRSQLRKQQQQASAPVGSISGSTAAKPLKERKPMSAAKAARRERDRDRAHMVRAAKKAVRVSQLLYWCPRQKRRPSASVSALKSPRQDSREGQREVIVHPCRRVRPTPVPEALFEALTSFANDAVKLRALYTERLQVAVQQQRSNTSVVVPPLPAVGSKVRLVEVAVHRHKKNCNTQFKRRGRGTCTSSLMPKRVVLFTTLVEDVTVLAETARTLVGFSTSRFRPRRRTTLRRKRERTKSQEAVDGVVAAAALPLQLPRGERDGVVVRAARHFPGSRGTRADLVHNLLWQNRRHVDHVMEARQFFEVQVGDKLYVL